MNGRERRHSANENARVSGKMCVEKVAGKGGGGAVAVGVEGKCMNKTEQKLYIE